MGETAKNLAMLLTDSNLLKRRKRIGDLITQVPDMHTEVISKKLNIGKSLITSDIEALLKEGHLGATKRKENNLYRVRKKNEIEKTLRAYPFTDQPALAKKMNVKYSELRKTIKTIKNKVEKYDQKMADLLDRRDQVTEYLCKNPEKTLANAALFLNISIDQLSSDQENFDDPRYVSLQNKYKIESMLSSIVQDMDACEEQFQLCVAIDPRSGSRWKEEKRKYKTLFIELARLFPKKGMDVNVSINRSPDERDAIRKAAELTRN